MMNHIGDEGDLRIGLYSAEQGEIGSLKIGAVFKQDYTLAPVVRGPKQELAFRLKQLLGLRGGGYVRVAWSKADRMKNVGEYHSREALNALCLDLRRNAEGVGGGEDDQRS